MKKIYVVFALSALALASGCRQEEPYMPESPSDGHEVTVTATLGDVSTKTRLGTDTKVYWSPGDAISIFSAGEHKRFVAQNTEPVKIAKFKGRISVITGASDGTAKDYIWGFYPYSQDNVYSEPEGVSETATITATLPSEQTAVAGTFNDGYAVAIGRSETLGISFQNLYSGFWFTLTNRNDIHSVTLSSDQPLAGRFTAGLDASGTPEIKEIVEGSNSITLTAPDGGTFERGKAYYFVLFPGTYNLTVTARTSTLEGSREIRNLTLQRNNLAVGSKNLDEKITSSGTGFDYILPAANEIWIETDQDDEWAVLPSVLPDGVTVENAERRDDGVIVLTFSEALPAVLPDRFFSYYPGQSGSSTNDSAKSLLSIALPAQVTTIGNYAFRECSGLSSISMGDVTTIGDLAFRDCGNLWSISLPETLLEIGAEAFRNCTALTSISLNEGLAYIGRSAFWGCSSLESVYLPESIVSMNGNPFAYCPSLSTFQGKFVQSHPESSMQNRFLADGTTVLAFAPAGVTTAFLKSDTKTIGAHAFAGCEELKEVTMSYCENLSTIGWGAFLNCTRLRSIIIPESVRLIETGAFDGCTADNLNIVMVGIPEDETEEQHSIFPDPTLNYRISVPFGHLATLVSTAPWSTYKDRYYGFQADNEIVVKYDNSVSTSLADIEAAVKDLDFGSGAKLTRIDPIEVYGDQAVLVFDGTVTQIPENAFKGIKSLRYVWLNDPVTALGNYAFSGSSIEGIYAPGVETVGSNAFAECSNLVDVSLPAVTSLGVSSFRNTGLTSVSMRYVTDLPANVFFYCQQLVSASFPAAKSLGYYAFNSCKKLKNFYLPDGLDIISQGALANCAFESMEIPSSVTSIGREAFSGNASLSKVTSYRQTPPTGGYNMFIGTSSSLRIIVPIGAVSAYKAATNWSAYQDKIEESPAIVIQDVCSYRFIDGVDVGEIGSFMYLEDLTNLSDANGNYFCYNPSYWSDYGPFTITVDTSHIECDLTGSRSSLPTTIRITQSGTSATGAESSMIYYQNNGTMVTSPYNLYIPVTVNCSLGTFNEVIKVQVAPAYY